MEKNILKLHNEAKIFVEKGGEKEVITLIDEISNFIKFSDLQPDSIYLNAPIDTDLSNYGPPGNPPLLIWGLLREIENWMHAAQILPLYKINQLLKSFIHSLSNGYYQTAMMNARAIIETTALARYEWTESEKKSKVLLEYAPDKIRSDLQDIEKLQLIGKSCLDMLTHYRILLQKTRTDWSALLHTDPNHENKEEMDKRLTQTNVFTAIDKLSFPSTRYGNTPRMQYEVMSDFVHPNRGSSMLFYTKSVVKNGYVQSRVEPGGPG